MRPELSGDLSFLDTRLYTNIHTAYNRLGRIHGNIEEDAHISTSSLHLGDNVYS